MNLPTPLSVIYQLLFIHFVNKAFTLEFSLFGQKFEFYFHLEFTICEMCKLQVLLADQYKRTL